MLINNYHAYFRKYARNIYFYLPPKISPILENLANKLNIEYVEHLGYYIPKSDVEGFDPETNGMSGPSVDDNGICRDETCQKLGYCRLKKKKKKCSTYKMLINQIELPFE